MTLPVRAEVPALDLRRVPGAEFQVADLIEPERTTTTTTTTVPQERTYPVVREYEKRSICELLWQSIGVLDQLLRDLESHWLQI